MAKNTAKKKSKKPLVIGGILLLVAAMVAVLGLRTVTEEAIEAAASSRQDFDPPTFVRFGRMVFPVIRRNRVVAQLAVTITLEVVEDSVVGIVEENDTRLRDAYLAELHRVSVWRHAESGYALPLDLVKARLLDVSERVLGEDIVVDVLLSAAVERNLQ